MFRIQCLLLLLLVCLLGCATTATTTHTASAPSSVVSSKQPVRFIPYGRDDASVTFSQKQGALLGKLIRNLSGNKKVELVKDHSVMANGVFLVDGQMFMWEDKYIFCWDEKVKQYRFLADGSLKTMQVKLNEVRHGRRVDDLSREEWEQVFEVLGK